MQRALFFLVSMITTFTQISRFSSPYCIPLLSLSSKILHCQSFNNQDSTSYRRQRISILRKQQQRQMATISMTGMSHQDEMKQTVNDNCGVKSAKMIPLSSTNLEKCGERLRQGGLVAFPTETVYGLGCNALDESAIIKVFEAKERPLTDPLITHVTDNQVAFQLWAADTTTTTTATTDSSSCLEGRAIHALCDKFWPGPLTLVAKAAPNVPPILMANTGFVACRSPQHPISIVLINAAKVPIAAPSANKFGHISPTRSHHVWDDLKNEDVWIVKEEEEEEEEEEESTTKSSTDDVTSCCQVGVESSVAKIEMITADNKKGRITLLRQGAVSLQDIQECLTEAGLVDHFEVLALTKKTTDETVANVAPGQTIRHYSPDIPSFILSKSLTCRSSTTSDDGREFLRKSVLIDFGGKLKAWEHLSLAYRDLSETADSAEATRGVFETLRWAEQISDANQILFPEIADDEVEGGQACSPDALTLALKDRLTRAASGVVIDSLHTGIYK
jgi:L-threonylcarbamoyladenylate synthase